MKPENILQAIGDVDETLIERASKKTPNPFWRWSGIAAALILVVGIAYVVFQQGNLKPPTPPTEGTEASPTEAPEMDASEMEAPTEEEPAYVDKDYYIAYVASPQIVHSNDFTHTWGTLTDCADMYGWEYVYYRPTEDSAEAYTAAMEQVISDGCNVIISSGLSYCDSLIETAPLYPEVTFIGLDVDKSDFELSDTADPFDEYQLNNVLIIDFQDEIAGYLAGYSAVQAGYTSLGFYAGVFMPEVSAFANGLALGVRHAAEEYGCEDEIILRFAEHGNFSNTQSDAVLNRMNTWIQNGTQVIITHGQIVLTECAMQVGADMVIAYNEVTEFIERLRLLRPDRATVVESVLYELACGTLTLGCAKETPYYEFIDAEYAQADDLLGSEELQQIYDSLIDGTRECPSKTDFNPDDYEIEIIWE